MRVRLKHRNLARLLAMSRLSQNGWARRLQLDSGHLSKLVNGRRPYPGPRTRRKLLDGLGVGFDDLFEIEEPHDSLAVHERGHLSMSEFNPVAATAERGQPMASFTDDLRLSLRSLIKRPGFTVVAVLTLMLGIGVNTAIFSVVDQVLLQPLPYPDAERLVMIWGHHPQIGRETASLPDYVDWREQSDSFSGMAAMRFRTQTLSGRGTPTRVTTAMVAQDFFEIFGEPLARGRGFTEAENRPGQGRVAVLNYGFWEDNFGSDETLIGSEIRLDDLPLTIVGIAEPGFDFPQPDGVSGVDLWTPLDLDPADFSRRADFLRVVARLAPGRTIEQSNLEMTAIMARLEEQYPDTNTDWSAEVISLEEQVVGNLRGALWSILGAVGFVMLIACANVANLLLARSSSRQREIAIRAALGAGRWRIVRQLLTESVLLGVAGGAAGLLAGVWLFRGLVAMGPALPRLTEATLSLTVMLFALTLSLITGVLFGLAPVLQLSSLRLSDSLREGGRGGGEFAGSRLRSLLVVAEVALALVLLIGAGLMLKSFQQLLAVDPGFKAEDAITFRVSLPPSGYPESVHRGEFFDRLLGELESLPGVNEVAAVSDVPLEGAGAVLSFAVRGEPPVPDDEIQDTEVMVATPNYFRALGIPLIEGAGFPERAGEERLALINETARRKYWSDRSPVGDQITITDPQNGPWFRIVGVVGDTLQEGLDREPYAQMYADQRRMPQRSMALIVRTTAGLGQLADPIRDRVRRLDSRLPGITIRTLEEVRAGSIERPRLAVYGVGAFGAMALLLAGVGIYGVISYAVNRRVHEIGVRVTLGARRGSILGLVVRQGMTLAASGIAAGLVGARLLAGLLDGVLFKTSPTDPATSAVMALFLAAVALAACVIPARRATRVDPLQALRTD